MSSLPEMPFINNEQTQQELLYSLLDVPDEACLATAVYFEKSAKRLRDKHKVWVRGQAIKRRVKQDIAKLHILPRELMLCMGKGMNFDKAASVVADKFEVPRETVHSYWLKSVKEIQNKAILKRNEKIIAMRAHKHSTNAIANTLSLSSRHVRRIIREYKGNFP